MFEIVATIAQKISTSLVVARKFLLNLYFIS